MFQSRGSRRLITTFQTKINERPRTMGASFNVYIVAFAQLPAVYAQAAMA